jgi:hypothetical protein
MYKNLKYIARISVTDFAEKHRRRQRLGSTRNRLFVVRQHLTPMSTNLQKEHNDDNLPAAD